MTQKDKTIQCRVETEVWESFKELSDRYDCARSKLVRPALLGFLDQHKEELPDWLKAEIGYKNSQLRNNAAKRQAHLESNVRETADDFLDKTPAMPPDRFERVYVDDWRDKVKETHSHNVQEKLDFLDKELERYSLKHPSTSVVLDQEDYDSMIEDMAYYFRRGMSGDVEEQVREMVKNGSLPDTMTASRVMEDIREEARDRSNEEFNKAARPYLEDNA